MRFPLLPALIPRNPLWNHSSGEIRELNKRTFHLHDATHSSKHPTLHQREQKMKWQINTMNRSRMMVVGLSSSLFLCKLHYVTLCNNRNTSTYTCTYSSILILTLATNQINPQVLGYSTQSLTSLAHLISPAITHSLPGYFYASCLNLSLYFSNWFLILQIGLFLPVLPPIPGKLLCFLFNLLPAWFPYGSYPFPGLFIYYALECLHPATNAHDRK